MRKTVAVLCTLVLVAPALGAITYTPMPPAPHAVGLFNPANPGTLNTVYVDPAFYSDVFTFTFAMHHSQIWYAPNLLHFAFAYDNDSIEVLHARPVGGWTANNYSSMSWPNPTGGRITVSSLTNGFQTPTAYTWQSTSAVVPFFQVELHIKSEQESMLNMFGVVAMTLWSHLYPITLTPGQFRYGMGMIHEVPEPSSLMLLGGVVTAMAGGAIRRRRRS